MHSAGLVSAHETHLTEYAWSMLQARGESDEPDFRLQAKFRATFGRPVRIRFLGLYDTVKSVGWVNDQLVLPYTANNASVDAVRHAVAIDERRCFFRQNLWAAEPSAKTDVKEVWFAGVHADIGGGYPPEQAQLALLAQAWMMGEAHAAGLALDAALTLRQLRPLKDVAADPLAAMHDSMGRAWKIAEWVPRRVWSGIGTKKSWQIGAMPPLRRPPPRPVRPQASVHWSVERRRAGLADYRPVNLAGEHPVVDDDPQFAPWLAAAGENP